MKVHILIYSQWELCEGGFDEVRGVFSRWEDAFAAVRKDYPEAKRRKNPARGKWRWEREIDTYSFEALSIETHVVS